MKFKTEKNYFTILYLYSAHRLKVIIKILYDFDCSRKRTSNIIQVPSKTIAAILHIVPLFLQLRLQGNKFCRVSSKTSLHSPPTSPTPSSSAPPRLVHTLPPISLSIRPRCSSDLYLFTVLVPQPVLLFRKETHLLHITDHDN